MTIGERIKNARNKIKMTQAQLASETGISVMTVRRFEAGVSAPKSDTLTKIAIALGVDTIELLGYDPAYIGSTFEKFQDFIASMGYLIISGYADGKGGIIPFKEKKVRLAHYKQLENGELSEPDTEPVIITQAELDILVNASRAAVRGLLDDIISRGEKLNPTGNEKVRAYTADPTGNPTYTAAE